MVPGPHLSLRVLNVRGLRSQISKGTNFHLHLKFQISLKDNFQNVQDIFRTISDVMDQDMDHDQDQDKNHDQDQDQDKDQD